MEILNEGLEYITAVTEILLKLGKENPELVEYLSKNKLVATDEGSNLSVIISYRREANLK